MSSARDFAIVSAVLLALVLWLRPVVGRLGAPESPEARGHAAVSVPATATKDSTLVTSSARSKKSMSTSSGVEPVSASISYLQEVERLVLERTNEERRRQGLSPVRAEEILRDTSRAHNDDMLKRGFFDHVNPDGAAPGDRILLAHRRLVGLTGENIWMGSGHDTSVSRELADKIMDGWMASPGHRANILRSQYTHLGVGVSVAGDEVRATQNFGAIRAYTMVPVPATVSRGASLDLRLELLARGEGASLFDVWSSELGKKAAGPLDLDQASVDVTPGEYSLRFYFSSGPGSYNIYPGPRIEVQ